MVVVLLLGSILAIYGWRDAAPGRPNTFLNFDNLIDGIATPMSYYAIMAVGVTIVIITGGIDISVGSVMALSALGGAAALQNLPVDASAAVVLHDPLFLQEPNAHDCRLAGWAPDLYLSWGFVRHRPFW